MVRAAAFSLACPLPVPTHSVALAEDCRRPLGRLPSNSGHSSTPRRHYVLLHQVPLVSIKASAWVPRHTAVRRWRDRWQLGRADHNGSPKRSEGPMRNRATLRRHAIPRRAGDRMPSVDGANGRTQLRDVRGLDRHPGAQPAVGVDGRGTLRCDVDRVQCRTELNDVARPNHRRTGEERRP